ncbi:MAG: hypothetical protein ACF787_05995, partial [Rhodopirellula sp. JB053]
SSSEPHWTPNRGETNLFRRKVLPWASIDLGVGRADLNHLPHIKVHRVAATHLSIVLQPNVFRLVETSLFHDQNGSEPGGSSPSSKSSS